MTAYTNSQNPREPVELPVLPVAITTLMSMDIESESAFEELMALARLDPSMAIKVLQIAASAETASGGETLPRAMMCIGVRGLERLVSEQSSARIFVPTSEAEKAIWQHSVQVGLLSEALAKALPDLGVDGDRAQLAGLLHDVGRMVYYERIASSPNEIEAVGYDSPETLLLAEEETFGRSHVDVGREAITRWSLPRYVADTITFHHDRIKTLRLKEEKTSRLVELVQFADEISVFAMRGHAIDSDDFSQLYRRYLDVKSVFLKKTHITQQKVSKVAKETLAHSSVQFLSLKLGKPPA